MSRAPLQILKESGIGLSFHHGTFPRHPTFEDRLRGWSDAIRTHPVEVNRNLVLVALRAHHQLDYEKLAAVLSVDAAEVKPALPVRVRKTLGFERGFETIVTDVEVRRFLDLRVMWRQRVTITTGTPEMIVGLPTKALLSISRATLCDVAVEPDPPDEPERELEHGLDGINVLARDVPFSVWVPSEVLNQTGYFVIRHIGSSSDRYDSSAHLALLSPSGEEVHLFETTDRVKHERARENRRRGGSPLIHDVLVERAGTWISLMSADIDEGGLRRIAESLVELESDG